MLTPPEDIWPLLMNDPLHGLYMQQALNWVARLPPEVLADAAKRLQRDTTVGPIADAAAYQDPRIWENAGELLDVLEAVRRLRTLTKD